MCATGAFCVMVASLLAAPAQVAGQAQRTSGVRPSRLAEAAARIELDRTVAESEDGQIVISDDNLKALAAGGKLTTGQTGAWTGGREAGAGDDSDAARLDNRRSYWRERHHRQLDKVRALEDKLAVLDQRVEQLKEACFSTGRLSRRSETARASLEKARQEREALAERLEGERAELDHIIREARLEGAQPGWFR